MYSIDEGRDARFGVPVNWLEDSQIDVIDEGRRSRFGVPVNWLRSSPIHSIVEGRFARFSGPVRQALLTESCVIDEGRVSRFSVPPRHRLVQSAFTTTPFSHVTPYQEQTGVRAVHVSNLSVNPSTSDSIAVRSSAAEVSVAEIMRRKMAKTDMTREKKWKKLGKH